MNCLVGLLLFSACSEDELVPSGMNDNAFAVPDGQTDAVSGIRRSFYKQNGIHLLFNDTLRKEYTGKDAYGDDVWKVETIGLGYNLTASSNSTINLEYLATQEEMEEAVRLVEKHILPHIQGGSLKPYSILIVKSMEEVDSYGDTDELAVWTNMRCLAISVGEWLEMDEDEQAEQGLGVLVALLQSKFSYTSDAAEPFLAYCDEYYYEDIVDYIPDWDRNIEDIYALGMLDYGEDWEDASYDWFISDKADFNAFFDAVMSETEEEFAETYGEYPILMQKYKIMRDIIIDLGYTF